MGSRGPMQARTDGETWREQTEGRAVSDAPPERPAELEAEAAQMLVQASAESFGLADAH